MSLSLDIANLARLYAEGEATPEQVVREVYARIQQERRSAGLDHARRRGDGGRESARGARVARFTASPSR